VEVDKIFENLDQATNLIEVTLKGGASERDWISEPIEDPDLRSRAEEIQSLLMAFKVSSVQRLENPTISKSGSVADQEYDSFFKTITIKIGDLERLMEIGEAENEEAFRRLFPMLLLVWAFIVSIATASLFILERKRRKVKSGLMTANAQLHAQADELAGHRVRLSELIDMRTAELKTANECLQVEMAKRLQTCQILHVAEKQNHELSNKLLTTQEIERKRISMELHDELGQSLNVIKLQLRIIEKDSIGKREECEKLLEYMDHVIEDVRRISRDLSPTILEDLGLTSALQWLTDNLKKDPNLRITADVEDIDHLFSRKNWITIYRVVQEALTNIMKHAQAENVSFFTRAQDGRVAFWVEDDGNGFDFGQTKAQAADSNGLGLNTMSERVKIMGGDYTLWSRKGSGTRITFSIPIEKIEA
jgi:signal transduction histidine kinase